MTAETKQIRIKRAICKLQIALSECIEQQMNQPATKDTARLRAQDVRFALADFLKTELNPF